MPFLYPSVVLALLFPRALFERVEVSRHPKATRLSRVFCSSTRPALILSQLRCRRAEQTLVSELRCRDPSQNVTATQTPAHHSDAPTTGARLDHLASRARLSPTTRDGPSGAMAQEPSSASSDEVAETSPAGSTEGGPISSPSRRPVAAAAASTAQFPSSESTAYTLPATKPPPRPKRTYGKAPTAAPPASVVPAAPPRLTLKETTSIVIPETDPNAPPASEPASVHSPEDRVKKPVLAASSSASQHTTDPTSEEDVGSKPERPARTFLGAIEDADSGDSSSDDAEVDVEMASWLAKRITRDDLDAMDMLEPAAISSAADKSQPAESSSLPPLTPSTKDASQAVDASGEATPVRASHDKERAQDAPPAVEVGPTSPQAAPSPPPRRRRRAIESDESDDEVVHEKAAPAREQAQEQLPTPAATAAPHGSKKERLKLLAEKRRQEQSESRRGKSAMAEELEAAAADQDDEVEGEPDDVVDEVDAIMKEASTAKKGRNGLISRKRKSKVRFSRHSRLHGRTRC